MNNTMVGMLFGLQPLQSVREKNIYKIARENTTAAAAPILSPHSLKTGTLS